MKMNEKGKIRWIRQHLPSITRAMNLGLSKANSDIVLFLDDDIIPNSDIVREHFTNYESPEVWAVVGQVLQPGEVPTDFVMNENSPVGLSADINFRFNATQSQSVANVIACNLSVRREKAIQVGGFDENFIGVAYRFETEFARRVWKAGGKILFEPMASIRHLRAPSGGTRSYGNHLTSMSPMHGVGDYYFALLPRHQPNNPIVYAHTAVSRSAYPFSFAASLVDTCQVGRRTTRLLPCNQAIQGRAQVPNN